MHAAEPQHRTLAYTRRRSRMRARISLVDVGEAEEERGLFSLALTLACYMCKDAERDKAARTEAFVIAG